MTQTPGARTVGGPGAASNRTYLEGTPGLEARDSVLTVLRANGHAPHTNSNNGFYWFVPCGAHGGAQLVRIASGRQVELLCLSPDPCTRDEVIQNLGLGDLYPTEQSALEQLKAALVDSAGMDNLPDPEPLIGDDIMFRDSLVWMVGKPGCMKSFTALDMAGCIATGETWQGYRVSQGPVLYVVAEGVRGTKKRVRAWEKSMGRPMDGVHFLPVAVQSRVEGQWSALVELARELTPVMIVIDTQARVTVGVEENSNTAMGEFVDQAERLRRASGATVVIVHHIGRTGDTGRGATTLDGAMSTIIKVTKDDDRVSLECQKNKDGAEWDPIHLRPAEVGDSVVLMIDDGTRPSGGLSQAAVRMAAAWCTHHGSGDTVGVSNLVDVVASRSAFYRNLRELEQAGMVVVDRTGRYPRYRLTRCPE